MAIQLLVNALENCVNSSVIVLIPIYKPTLDSFEQLSVDQSVSVLSHREVCFIGPENLDRRYYTERYPAIKFQAYPMDCFASIIAYNRLMLDRQFYQSYGDFEFVLILQTDAILLRDELDYWCGLPIDYVGAPWPDGVEILVNAGAFADVGGKKVRAHVGNGGLSLRRVKSCSGLLQEFPEILNIFLRTGSSEDLYFSIMGGLSESFMIPNELMASRFSLELRPSYYHAINGGRTPMGGHAWWKSDPEYWRPLVPAFARAGQAA